MINIIFDNYIYHILIMFEEINKIFKFKLIIILNLTLFLYLNN